MAKKLTAQDEKIAELKDRYIEYYKDLPVQKYAAMYVGRDEETIMRWRKDDVDFEGRVNLARAEWVKRKASKAKVEFALERLEKSIFKETSEVTHIIPQPILGGLSKEGDMDGTVPTDDSTNKDK